ncbi:MAG: hypothetical protein ACH37Z_03380 [Anaerolineae bacterium]|jgi:hypothetical protein|nr:hypothetical protein [Ardenticatenia bacterium]MBK8540340.1 hypothetical protein [Ardenticatenia bacterium]HQZ70045.1 hypothetical protein [Anaerolineae bacterium]HRA18965.1 hypothetical protein [Anaerolineae bacterium]
MGRLISVESPSTIRQRWRRTIAEALKHLMAKRELDEEVKDLSALIVFALREISAGVEQSASVWDKKHYYIKADHLRADWEWADRTAERMVRLIQVDDWLRLPVVLAEMAPRFADVNVNQFTRTNQLWRGAFKRLKAEA